MVFNIQKFLVKNKLTKRSRLNEDAETKTDAEKVAMGAEEGDEEMFDPDSNHPYRQEKVSSFTGSEIPWPQRDPLDSTRKDVDDGPSATDANKIDRATSSLHKKELKLKSLEDIKDKLIMQYKSGQLKLDQYKAAIGNIPNQIKKLRFDIERQLDPVIGDSDEDDI